MASFLLCSNARLRVSVFALLFLCYPATLLAQEGAARGQISPAVRRAIGVSRVLHEAPREQRLHLSIGLPLRNQDELDALLPQLNDPASANFHKYLTPAQFAAQFGPTEEDYQALIQFAEANGLTVTQTHANRGVLSVSGAMPEVEKAFQVKMMTYSHPTRGEFYAPDREPTLPVARKVLDVSGLDNFAPPQPMGVVRSALAQANSLLSGSGPGGYLIGKDFRAAYAPGVTLTGAGQTVGLLEFDGFFAGDVTKNFAAAGLPAVPTQTVLLDGMSGAPGGDNIEVILDIMMASYMAPGLTKVMVYEGETANDILNRMATDNLAQQISSSWGWGGVNATTEQIFKQYIAQGQSFLQASGDSGAYSGAVMPPSDDPNVTVVGGTSLATNGPGGSWLSETAWSGSGGGVSTTYAIPSYQTGVAMASKGGSTKMRNLPDVAMTADIEMYLICDNGAAISVGGTSAAAPLWAGFVALANQQAAANAKPRVGFVNPLIYAIGESGNYAADFHDITTGSDGFKAMGGYDLATGWGSPAGQHLIYDLTGTTGAPGFAVTSSVATVTLQGVTAGSAATASATLTIAPQGGFKGTVGLAVTGLPAGVTAAFSPVQSNLQTTAPATSVLTFTLGAAAVSGTYPVTVTGLSGSVSSVASLSLVVALPAFTLGVSNAAITAPRPGTATTTVSVGALNGFTGTVAFTATGLPAGVTAVFGTQSGAGTSVVTFSAGSAAAAGTSVVTINGVSGSLKASTTVSLTVTVPGFTLAFAPAALTVARGASATGSVTVGMVGGFNGNVTLAATGLPAGLTAVFGSTGASGTRSVTFSATSATVAGTFPVTISGVSGTLSAFTTVAVTVTAPSFTLAFAPATLAVPSGGSSAGTVTITAINGFNSGIAFSASGLPSGAIALFGTAVNGAVIVNFLAAPGQAGGSYAVTLTGVSGTLTQTAKLTLVVVASVAATSFVNLAPMYNVGAMAVDGVAFSGGGLDGGLNGSTTAYSANLIGAQQMVGGTTFYFGPAGVLDAVSGQTVALPAGKFTALKLLATGVNGSQPQQSFKVTYTDGTSTTAVQSVSDWFTPGGYAGETRALTMTHRDTGTGLLDARTFYLYEYSVTLNPVKTVASMTLPGNRNVVVLAATLTGGVTGSVVAAGK